VLPHRAAPGRPHPAARAVLPSEMPVIQFFPRRPFLSTASRPGRTRAGPTYPRASFNSGNLTPRGSPDYGHNPRAVGGRDAGGRTSPALPKVGKGVRSSSRRATGRSHQWPGKQSVAPVVFGASGLGGALPHDGPRRPRGPPAEAVAVWPRWPSCRRKPLSARALRAVPLRPTRAAGRGRSGGRGPRLPGAGARNAGKPRRHLPTPRLPLCQRGPRGNIWGACHGTRPRERCLLREWRSDWNRPTVRAC
jgi:hypothetical protein